MSGSQQSEGVAASAQLPGVTSAMQGSLAPLQPLIANGQQAPGALRRAPARKRGRAAVDGQQASTATFASATEMVKADTPSLLGGASSQAAQVSLAPDAVQALPKQPTHGAEHPDDSSKAKPKRQTRQSKAVAANGSAALDQQAVKSEVPADVDMQSDATASASAAAQPVTKAKRKPRQTKAAAQAFKQDEQASAGPQEEQTAAAKQEEGIVSGEPHSIPDVKAEPSETSAMVSAANAQPARATDKPKPVRKPRQSKAAAAAAAPGSTDTADTQAGAVPAAAKVSKQKRAKVEKVVADASAAVAQEATEQDPAVEEAPVGGLNEHKPRVQRRPAKKAVPPPVDAANGDVSASEASAADGSASMSNASVSMDTAAAGKVSKPCKRGPRGKKAVAPAASADGDIGASEASVAGSDVSMSDAGASMEAAAAAPADGDGTSKTSKPRKRAPRTEKAAAPDGDAASSMFEASEGAAAKAKPVRKRAPKKAAAPDGQPSSSETSCDEIQVAGAASVKKVVKSRRKFKNELTTRLVAAARAALAAPETVEVPPLPVPNLGYACLNSTLQAEKPVVTNNRGAILRTYNEKGLGYISELALQNCKDLLPIVQWNHEHAIRLFRLSSDLFPWGDSGKYKLEELPDLPHIKEALAEVGTLARLYKQRLTSHPSEFVKMAAQKEDVIFKSLWDLELHSKVFDMMGFEPCMWNKINIHIGGTYGNTPEDKQATMERFIVNFHKLSPSMQKRLAVENDDKATQWSITDLLPLHERIGVPITFDFHHHRFCDGGLTEEQAFKAAIATWPKGVRPQVHWSEEPEDPTKVRRAHSKFIRGPMNLYGHEGDVDIMVEAKAKELTVLDFRNTAHLDVGLPTVAGTLDSQELVRTEYDACVDGAQKARGAVEAAEVDAAAKRAQAAAAAEAAGATKFLN